MKVFDLATPATPLLVSVYDTVGFASSVKVVGSVAHVGDGVDGLVSIDFSNYAAPLMLSECDTLGDAQWLELSGSLAYVADGSGGLHVLRIPTSPLGAVITHRRTGRRGHWQLRLRGRSSRWSADHPTSATRRRRCWSAPVLRPALPPVCAFVATWRM